MRLELGMRVRCSDQELGELADVVINPETKRVTHLVVRSPDAIGPARLVPIALVDPAGDADVCLRCTLDEAGRLKPVQDFAYLRMGEFILDDPDWDVGIERVLTMPYSRAGELGGDAIVYDDHVAISYDRVPKGEVEIRRESSVTCADGEVIGHVDGFVLGEDDQITHLVLKHGHLWNKRAVTIPVEAVEKVETDCVTITLTSRDVRDLPRH